MSRGIFLLLLCIQSKNGTPDPNVRAAFVQNIHCYWKYLELEWKGFQELELNKVSIELHVAELIKGT